MDTLKFFCAFSETLTDVANALVDADLPVPAYGPPEDLLDALPVSFPGQELLNRQQVFGLPGYRGEKPFESTDCAVKDLVFSLCPPLRHSNDVIHIVVYMSEVPQFLELVLW